MSILPIVDRELRVASRRWTTFLLRGGVGLVAMVLAGLGLITGWLASGGAAVGQGAFSVLAGYVFLLAFAGGLIVTADCLSSEKRDGTLGLLFLTDLRGYDVVLGKFAGLGLHAMYGMVAVFPALALPLLTGGVTGGEFWRVSLALLNLLFVSLSVGMVVSAAGRQASTVLWMTLVILLSLVAVIPIVVNTGMHLKAGPAVRWVGWINPGQAFSLAQTATTRVALNEYWLNLGMSHACGWVCLALAAVILPRSWQDREVRRERAGVMRHLLGERVAGVFRIKRPNTWLENRPVLWLMGDRPTLRMLLWAVAGVWCVGVLMGCVFVGPREIGGTVFGVILLILVGFGLLLIEHTCRFWVDARQNGSLEVLLSVPIGSKEILSAHWASIRKHFLWPLVVVLCAGTLPTWGVMWLTLSQGEGDLSYLSGSLIMHVYLVVGIAWLLATFAAIGYTGVWFALRLKRPQFAVGLTFLCVGVLPVFLCWLGLGVTLVFIFLPMSLLHTNLRGMILQHYAPTSKPVAPVRA